MYNKILKLIKEYQTIIIHRHGRPDGDALGSQIGLRECIRENFPIKNVYAVGDEINRYSFIGKMDIISDEVYNDALVFVLDTSEQALISDERYKKGNKLVKIDHHIAREKFGDVEVVEDSFESCCGLIADIIFKSHLVVSSKVATALYTGIITDSGRFRYDSTSSRTFLIASKLLENGADINDIYNKLYLEELDTVLLRAKFILKMKLTPNNVAYVMTTNEEIIDYKQDVFTVSRGMVNTMAGIKDVDIWVNFTEDVVNNGVIVEIRSNKYNINPIAVKYGGGGHAKASGATVDSFDTAKKILEELDALAKTGNNNE